LINKFKGITESEYRVTAIIFKVWVLLLGVTYRYFLALTLIRGENGFVLENADQ